MARNSAKVRVLRSVVCDGEDLEEGKTYEIAENDAAYLMALGKAEPAERERQSKERPAPGGRRRE